LATSLHPYPLDGLTRAASTDAPVIIAHFGRFHAKDLLGRYPDILGRFV
jgi:hypothetical protein